MGREMEWKLAVPYPSLFVDILLSDLIRSRMIEQPRRCRMQTSYYDTPDRRFSRKLITLRRRMENETSVICVKAPFPDTDDPHLRGEWELEGQDVREALPQLIAMGAPKELLEAEELVCLWQAEFTRRAVLLRLDGGGIGELALDEGRLKGPDRSAPLCELELELKQGGPEAAADLIRLLQRRFDLKSEPLSKLARAMALEDA